MEGLEWLKDNVLVKENIKKVEKLQKIADGLAISMPVLAISWCLKNVNVSSVILGASELIQLKENFKALDTKEKLTPEIMGKIEKILNNAPLKPIF